MPPIRVVSQATLQPINHSTQVRVCQILYFFIFTPPSSFSFSNNCSLSSSKTSPAVVNMLRQQDSNDNGSFEGNVVQVKILKSSDCEWLLFCCFRCCFVISEIWDWQKLHLRALFPVDFNSAKKKLSSLNVGARR